MIERSKPKTNNSNRKRADRVNQKRRLMMEGLESRQLLAVFTDLPTAPAPTNLPVYTQNRNIGAVQAFNYIESERLNETGKNDNQFTADYVPLGTAPGKQSTIDITGALPVGIGNNQGGFTSDLDTFSFDLRGGDILDVATLGAAGDFSVRDSNGLIIFGSMDVSPLVPAAPLQTLGNVYGTVVIPRDGRYSLTVAPDDTQTNYTLGLRVYRPVSESLSVGDAPILYLDFDGDILDGNLFTNNQGLPVPGFVRIPSLAESLPLLGLQYGDVATANQIINDIVDNTVRIFEDITRTGSNGDFAATSNPGDYGIRILNSRDHRGQISFSDPRVTRMLIGGSGDDILNTGVYGFAETVDIGNFDLNQLGFFALDAFAATPVLLSPSSSLVDFWGLFLGSVVAHEAGHTFGLAHTENANTIGSLADAGGTVNSINYFMGIGPDLIFGTADDIQPIFQDDFYINNRAPANVIVGEFPFFGFNEVTDNLSHVLSTGTRGGNVSGRAFSDLNSNGSGTGDPGLAGVTVYADVNRNGSLDPGEPSAVTGASGNFTLSVGPGSVDVIALTPTGYVATTATKATVTVTVGGNTGGINFGFHQVDPNATGIAFVDSNGNASRDAGEAGLGGVYIYLDLDGDDRPDLGEPGTNTASDGSYSLNFPGPGNYVLRSDLKPGYERTLPANGEWLVSYNGVAITQNYDFGFLPSQDFGDLPFLTTVAQNGASHGIVAGLTLGATVDRESDGQPTAAANGDDINGIDDEDGVRPIAPSVFEITVNNTTSSTAYVQGFVDINGDGDFLDIVNGVNEHIAVDVPVPAGTVNGKQTFVIPAEVEEGTYYTRVRLSQTQGLKSVGFAKTGEVEDYRFSIVKDLVNPDSESVSRNSRSNPIFVLSNDFNTPDYPLDIVSVFGRDETSGALLPAGKSPHGEIRIGTADNPATNQMEQVVFYTPNLNYIGTDSFYYQVEDPDGELSEPVLVSINVLFLSQVPIAVDDVFEVPQGSSNRALNVLDNDIASVNGGLSIISVTSPSNGGTVSIVGGGQSIRYTPGSSALTEQFTYTIQDQAGNISSAEATINLLPDSRNDDIVEFSIKLLDENRVPLSGPSLNVPVDSEFYVQVSVKDLRDPFNPPAGVDPSRYPGVYSAFLDLLYSNTLVAPVVSSSNVPNVTFGGKFSLVSPVDINVPGLVNEIGGTQGLNSDPHDVDFGNVTPDILFTMKMRATSPGAAVFQVDPADEVISETTVLDPAETLTPAQLRLGSAQLVILPPSDNYPAAVDDSFPEGLDSLGMPITNTAFSTLRVLDNDVLGPQDKVLEFGIEGLPRGSVIINDNNSPDDLNDDYLSYRAPVSDPNGLDSFRYFIVTENVDGLVSVSTAEVTVALGNQQANSQVDFDFVFVADDGITPLPVGPNGPQIAQGEQFGVQIRVEDIRNVPTYVFAGYLDVLYDSLLITPSAPDASSEPGFDFAVEFGPHYRGDAGVGSARTSGIIDEFGTVIAITPTNPDTLATIYFDAVNAGVANVVGSPADASPFQDTLLFGLDDPINRSRLRFHTRSIEVLSSTPLQNPLLAQDVNDDGSVTPVDALLVINQISLDQRAGEGEAAAAGGLSGHYYTDVNGDNLTSSLDALLVINYLSAILNGQASGEQVVAPSDSVAASASTTDSTDNVFAQLGDDSVDKVVSTDSGSSASSGLVATSSGSTSSADDEDDDVLALLADDVSGLWG